MINIGLIFIPLCSSRSNIPNWSSSMENDTHSLSSMKTGLSSLLLSVVVVVVVDDDDVVVAADDDDDDVVVVVVVVVGVVDDVGVE